MEASNRVLIIFPRNAWEKSELGFSGIRNLKKRLDDEGESVKEIREYQAVVFEIEDFKKENSVNHRLG